MSNKTDEKNVESARRHLANSNHDILDFTKDLEYSLKSKQAAFNKMYESSDSSGSDETKVKVGEKLIAKIGELRSLTDEELEILKTADYRTLENVIMANLGNPAGLGDLDLKPTPLDFETFITWRKAVKNFAEHQAPVKNLLEEVEHKKWDFEKDPKSRADQIVKDIENFGKIIKNTTNYQLKLSDLVHPKTWKSVKFPDRNNPTKILSWKMIWGDVFIEIMLSGEPIEILKVDFEYILTNHGMRFYRDGSIKFDEEYGAEALREYKKLNLPEAYKWFSVVVYDNNGDDLTYNVIDYKTNKNGDYLVRLKQRDRFGAQQFWTDPKSIGLKEEFLYVVDKDGSKYGPAIKEQARPKRAEHIVNQVVNNMKKEPVAPPKPCLYTRSYSFMDEDGNFHDMPDPPKSEGWVEHDRIVVDIWKQDIANRIFVSNVSRNIHHESGAIWWYDYQNLVLDEMKIVEVRKFCREIKASKSSPEKTILSKLW